MKKCWILLIGLLFLSGCGGKQPLETVADELLIPVLAPQRELILSLPEDAAEQVLSVEESRRLYFCDGYSLSVQIFEGGDLERTVQNLCGYGTDKLTGMATRHQGTKRYDWAWTSASEEGARVGRAAVLDDGSYHYCVSVMAQETMSGQLGEPWERIFASLSLSGGVDDQSS